jgi:Cysteine-rich secretory protein family
MAVARLSWIFLLTLGEVATPTPARRLVPRKAGAPSYESRPASESTFTPFGDPLRAEVQRAAAAAGRKQGTRVVPDTRLDAAMTDLARALREGESPHSEAVDFVLSHYGIVEPYPQLRFVRFKRAAEATALESLTQKIRLPSGKPLATIGVGLDRDTSWLLVIVAIQDKSLDLEAVPRRLPHGGQTPVAGKLLGHFAQPHLYVTDPKGAARTLPAEMKGALFRAEVRCDRGDGRYQVEVFGSDEAGPRVLANFPIYCGAAPPDVFTGAAGYAASSLKPEQAEARLLELVNRDRRTAGLPPLAADAELAAVARAHSVDMLENNFVGHISPTTGSPVDRVKRAGLAFKRLSENVGRNSSVEELEIGLMASPGHRSAILDPLSTRVGIGMVVDAPTPDAVVVIGTQLFR